MKHLKILMFLVVAFLSFSSLNAQTTKKKAATKQTTTAKKYQCPMKCEGDKTYAKEGKCPKCNMKLKEVSNAAATAAYQCPMKCEGDKTYAEAGKCPKCNMDLQAVTKKTDEHADHQH